MKTISMMWTCPRCSQQFVQQHQHHSCGERTAEDFLEGKSPRVTALYHYFVKELTSMGGITMHPAKARIGFAAKTRFGYIHRIGKDYIDVVLHFQARMEDTLCFYKIAGAPGSDRYNHYFRLYSPDDMDTEVRKFLLLAYEKDINEGG